MLGPRISIWPIPLWMAVITALAILLVFLVLLFAWNQIPFTAELPAWVSGVCYLALFLLGAGIVCGLFVILNLVDEHYRFRHVMWRAKE